MSENILPRRTARSAVWIAGIVASFLLAGTAGAGAALNYDKRTKDIVLPGLHVGGVDLTGLTFGDARAAVAESLESSLKETLVVEVAGQTFLTTPAALGATSNAQEVLERALVEQGNMSPARRLRARAVHAGPSDRAVTVSLNASKLEAFIADLKARVNRAPAAPSVELTPDGIQITPGAPGFTLAPDAVGPLRSAMSAGLATVVLTGDVVSAPVSTIRDVLVIRTGENKLYHYRHGVLVKEYGVATGTSRYPTPTGSFMIVNKRFRPTWVNPAKYPGGWGASLPARIGPGRGNPLGTRALDLNSPGIRIHGTYSSGSIGYNASHGCIRMLIAESEELFALVEVGTPVLIVRSGVFKNYTDKSSRREPTAESDATQVPQGQPPSPSPSPTPSPSPSPFP